MNTDFIIKLTMVLSLTSVITSALTLLLVIRRMRPRPKITIFMGVYDSGSPEYPSTGLLAQIHNVGLSEVTISALGYDLGGWGEDFGGCSLSDGRMLPHKIEAGASITVHLLTKADYDSRMVNNPISIYARTSCGLRFESDRGSITNLLNRPSV